MRSKRDHEMTCGAEVTLRPSLILLALLTSLVFAGCQSYTTGLQKSETRVDETAVTGALHTIAMAQQTYSVGNNGKYASFPQLIEAGFLDSRFASETPEVKGYVFTMDVGDKDFSCNADPATSTARSGRHFYIDSSSTLVRVNPTQPATASDPPLNR